MYVYFVYAWERGGEREKERERLRNKWRQWKKESNFWKFIEISKRESYMEWENCENRIREMAQSKNFQILSSQDDAAGIVQRTSVRAVLKL